MNSNCKILIVGKNSFIGTNFSKLSKYSDITEIDSFSIKPENISFAGFDIIIHLAAIVHQTDKISFDQYFEVNSKLPYDIAINAKNSGVKQFIFLSTTKVYGKYVEGQKPWTEDSECHPADAYGKSKYLAEKDLLKLTDQSFKVAILRTPMVYGEGVKANMKNFVRLINNLPIVPFAGMKNRRSITYVGNLIEFIDQIIALNAHGVFLAKDDISPTIEEISMCIAKALGKKRIFINPGYITLKLIRLIFPQLYEKLFSSAIVDNTKTINNLGINLSYDLTKGLDVTINSYKEHNN